MSEPPPGRWSDAKSFYVSMAIGMFLFAPVAIFALPDDLRTRRLNLPPDVFGGLMIGLGVFLCLYARRLK